ADEPILRRDEVVGERILVEEVTELAVELLPVVVPHFQQPVLDAERVAEVDAEVVALELRGPAGEVPAVEELNPVLRVGLDDRRRRAAGLLGGEITRGAGKPERGSPGQRCGEPPETDTGAPGEARRQK